MNSIHLSSLKNIFSFLDDSAREQVGYVNRRFAILANNDPTLGLVTQRVISSQKGVSLPGPTEIELKRMLSLPPETPVGLDFFKKISRAINFRPHRQDYLNLSTCPYDPGTKEAVEWIFRADPMIKKLMGDVIRNEREHSEYVPFYHAMRQEVFCYTLFTRALLATVCRHSEDLPSIPLIRFPDSRGIKTLHELFELSPPQIDASDPTSYDHKPEVRKELLSVNPTLFTHYSHAGEGTWQKFLKNESVCPPNSLDFFRMLCEHYQIPATAKTLEKLDSLYKKLVSCHFTYLALIRPGFEQFLNGLVLQILIPKNKVEQVAYPCQACGELETEPSPLSFSERLEQLRTNPDGTDSFQARIFIQSLFKPQTQAKVIVHGGGDFFSDKPLAPLFGPLSQESISKLELLDVRKRRILEKAGKLFSKELLRGCSLTRASSLFGAILADF